jgi:hypothetical protein
LSPSRGTTITVNISAEASRKAKPTKMLCPMTEEWSREKVIKTAARSAGIARKISEVPKREREDSASATAQV